MLPSFTALSWLSPSPAAGGKGCAIRKRQFSSVGLLNKRARQKLTAESGKWTFWPLREILGLIKKITLLVFLKNDEH